MTPRKTKQMSYSMIGHRAIGGVTIVPNRNQAIVIVAWENEKQAKQGNFAFYAKQTTYEMLNVRYEKVIKDVCDYGTELHEQKDIKKFFNYLF